MESERTLYVGNLSEQITEDILYELFLQAGPLEYVKLPVDKASKKPKPFAFICYHHECSASYAVYLLGDTKLYGKYMNIQHKGQNLLPPYQVGIHSVNPSEVTPAALNSQPIHPPFSRDHPREHKSSLLGDPLVAFETQPLHMQGYMPPMANQFAMAQLSNNLSNRLGWQVSPYNPPPQEIHLSTHSIMHRKSEMDDTYKRPYCNSTESGNMQRHRQHDSSRKRYHHDKSVNDGYHDRQYQSEDRHHDNRWGSQSRSDSRDFDRYRSSSSNYHHNRHSGYSDFDSPSRQNHNHRHDRDHNHHQHRSYNNTREYSRRY